MTLSFSVLASGSMGNATLLMLGRPSRPRYALIDCGISPRATAARLEPLGVPIEAVSDVVVTHMDADHFHEGWPKRIRKHGMTVHLHQRHRALALRRGLDGRHMHLFRQPFTLGDATRVEPVMLAHDALGTVGFVIDEGGTRLGYATDLGRVPRGLTQRFVELHALAIESNYDPDLQRTSGRPAFLKQRIMGGAGHLSNEEALDAVLEIDARSKLSHVVTLHLSRQCNRPRIVKRLFADRAPHLLGRLTISSQSRPTALLSVRRDRRPAIAQPRHAGQLALF